MDWNKQEIELISKALTEDIAIWLRKWLGQVDEIGIEIKTDIYLVVKNRFEEGVEI